MADAGTLDRLMSMRGVEVHDTSGETVGAIDGIFVDAETGRAEWIRLGTGFFGTKRVLVPVRGADLREDSVTIPYTRDQLQDAPDVEADEVSHETEAALYAHYGLATSGRRFGAGLAEGVTTGGEPRGTGDQGEVIRSEEELRVGKRETEAGRVRLRKWVETEPVETTVETRRERARVTREPVDQPVTGVELGEEEFEVTLRAEEPVVEKQTIAKERIGLGKDVETERQTVRDDVRKERVEVEDEAETP